MYCCGMYISFFFTSSSLALSNKWPQCLTRDHVQSCDDRHSKDRRWSDWLRCDRTDQKNFIRLR